MIAGFARSVQEESGSPRRPGRNRRSAVRRGEARRRLEVIGIGTVVCDGLEQLMQVHRFAEKGGECEPAGFRFAVDDAGEADDRNRRQPWVAQLTTPELLPVHARHFHVQEDEARRLTRFEEPQRLFAVARRQNPKAFLFDDFSHDVKKIRVVIDDENRLTFRLDVYGKHPRNATSARAGRKGW